MVIFVLYVKAELENINEIIIPKRHQWCLDIKQSNSDETRKNIFVSEEDIIEIPGSRGTANILIKWPGTKKESYLNVLRDYKGIESKLNGELFDNYVPIVAFDCRGLEPIAWYPEGGYDIISTNSLVQYNNIKLNDDWSDYDEESEQSIGIYNIEYKFEIKK